MSSTDQSAKVNGEKNLIVKDEECGKNNNWNAKQLRKENNGTVVSSEPMDHHHDEMHQSKYFIGLKKTNNAGIGSKVDGKLLNIATPNVNMFKTSSNHTIGKQVSVAGNTLKSEIIKPDIKKVTTVEQNRANCTPVKKNTVSKNMVDIFNTPNRMESESEVETPVPSIRPAHLVDYTAGVKKVIRGAQTVQSIIESSDDEEDILVPLIRHTTSKPDISDTKPNNAISVADSDDDSVIGKPVRRKKKSKLHISDDEDSDTGFNDATIIRKRLNVPSEEVDIDRKPIKRLRAVMISDDSDSDDDTPKTVVQKPKISKPVPVEEIEVSSIDGESSGSEEAESEEEVDEVELLLNKCEELATKIKLAAESNGFMSQSVDQENKSISINSTNYSTSMLVTNEQVGEIFDGELKLKDYQLVGLNWMHLLFTMKINGVLADEMGLGKTIQSIAMIGLLRKRYNVTGPYLVVAPGSTLENWKREMEKWIPELKVCMYHGNQKHRQHLIKKMSPKRDGSINFDVLLTTYTYFERQSSGEDRSFFGRFKFEYTIYDEAHAIKNLGSARYRRLVRLKSKHRLLLSGTPVQNNLLELLALMSFCMPKVFDASSEQLIDLFGEANSEATQRIRTALAPFILRRLKSDVLSQLSPKTEEIIKVKLEDDQDQVYKDIVACYRELRKQGNGTTNSNAMKEIKHVFTQLRKAANHPLLVRHLFGKLDNETGIDRSLPVVVRLLDNVRAFGPEATAQMIEKELVAYSDWDLHHVVTQNGTRCSQLAQMEIPEEYLWKSAKCRVLKKLLPDLIAKRHRILLFSQWTTILDIIECVLNNLDIKFVRFDGSTPVSERQQLVDQYHNDESIKVFLLSTRSGGMGINLTAADTVIIHDLDFNPTVDRQAEDRCHRIGQTKPVKIIKLVAEGTVDENILEMQIRKKQLDADVLSLENNRRGNVEADEQSMQKVIESLLM